MGKSIKSLLKKGKLTGAEVGRLIIADLVAAYENTRKGRTDGFGLFTPEEKQRLSDAVTGTQDIRDYNDYIAIYNFLKTYGAICQSMATSVELEFFRLYSLLSKMLEAETSYSLREIAPTIMTEKEYADKIQAKIDEYRQIGSDRETLDGCMGGIAVLQAHIFYPQNRVDENGWYIKEDAAVRFMKKNMAEAVLESFSETISNSLDSIKAAAAAYYSHAAAIELAGDIVGVEMTAPLLYPFPTDKIEGLNWHMEQAHDRPVRYEILDIDERVKYEDRLHKQLKETFAPINLESLKPDKDKLTEIRKSLTPASFRNLNLNELLAAG